ncbi:MAG: hypothetical protein V3S29_09635 [bacterium]
MNPSADPDWLRKRIANRLGRPRIFETFAGPKTALVADALAAGHEDTHQYALQAFRANFGDVQTVAEIGAALDG